MLHYTLSRPIAWVFFMLFGPLKIEGRKKVPMKGGVLLVSNHVSDADPPLIGLCCPRELRIMAKEELFKMPILGAIIRWYKAFPVKQRMADRTSLRIAEDYLKQGMGVLIFPEGMVSETGELLPFLPGSSLIVKRTKVPVVPVGIIGAEKIIPYGKLIPRPAFHRITVRFGDPIDFSDDFDKPDVNERIANRMMEAVAKLIDKPVPVTTT